MKKEIRIIKNKNGKIYYVQHYLDNKFHRDNDKPSYINYFANNGKIWYIAYRQYDLRHREYKPVYVNFDINGYIVYEEYCQNNVSHNDYGPSIIWYKEI